MAPTNDPDTTQPNAREDLKALLGSAGWRWFEHEVLQVLWSAEATLDKQATALKELHKGDHEAISDTVQQIQAARREVLKVMQLPSLRLQQLTPQQASRSPFAGLRRVAR